ncbi:unnamed protein product [Heterobilharzia americana]|nr:unnamed protein product [Heterobilharzia americana]
MTIDQMTIPEILSTNCRSLPNKVDYLQSLLSTNVYRNTGVIMLQETWLHNLYDDDLVCLDGFKLFRQDRSFSKKKCGGGVATFISTNWSSSNYVCFCFSNEKIECITIKCRPKHLSKYKYIYITNMYVTPDCSFSDLSTFADKFTEFAAPVLGNSLSIVCGDFNSCDYSFLLSLGHKNMVNFSTRLDNTLDFAFTNEPGIYEARKRAPLLNSDHCIIRVLPKVYGKLYKKAFAYLSRKVQYRCYSQENILRLRSMLIETDWDIFADEVLDNTITNITSYLRFCLDICCPTETIYMRFDRLSSPHLKRLRREKERLYKARDHPGVKRLNCLIKSEIQRLNTIYNEKFLSCKNSSNIWKLFKELTGKKQMTTQTRSDVYALNKSFIRRQANFTLPNVQNQVDSCFPGFNTNDVFKCLKSLNPSQSLGPDGVSSIIFRKCADILCHPLTDIFNVSFSKNIIPTAWKQIKIVPVPKPSSGSDVTFRPIAITSPFLKTMEKLLLLVIEPSLMAFRDPKQFAYKHRRSTLDAATVLHHNIVSSLDKGVKYVRCAFLDYSSAFDSVPRPLLLNKLAIAHTDPWVTKWLHSYFSERKQYTIHKGMRSTSLLTEAGVPQGAVLSPFLFSFFCTICLILLKLILSSMLTT